mmetsp:Transcript_21472/g.64229  ORF Transcript_21472/g.64229 Transcript_21472/m.64229 type:complete len:253 (+) Transcript_21472:2130-2888(+)
MRASSASRRSASTWASSARRRASRISSVRRRRASCARPEASRSRSWSPRRVRSPASAATARSRARTSSTLSVSRARCARWRMAPRTASAPAFRRTSSVRSAARAARASLRCTSSANRGPRPSSLPSACAGATSPAPPARPASPVKRTQAPRACCEARTCRVCARLEGCNASNERSLTHCERLRSTHAVHEKNAVVHVGVVLDKRRSPPGVVQVGECASAHAHRTGHESLEVRASRTKPQASAHRIALQLVQL